MKSHAIRTARVPAHLSRRRVTRATLERWLADADPARHGLPAQAIVLVRRLQSPWTALVDPEAGTRYSSLACALGGAARPALGEVAGDVVWFADEAELLACLARAALAGNLALQWWWKLVLRELAPAAARARWLQSLHAVPRALTRLEEPEARRWLAAWSAPEQRRLVQELARVFPLAAEAVEEEMARAQALAPAKASIASQGASAQEPVRATTDAPAGEGLRRLLFALAREPMAASDAQRVHALWHAAASRSTSSLPAPASARLVAVGTAAPAALRAHDPAARAMQELDAPLFSGSAPAPDGPGPAANEVLLPGVQAHASPAARAAIPALAASVAAAEVLLALTTPAACLRTEFGGLLFLLNAALQMGLYGDFTQPRKPRTLDCSPWRFLLASGRLYAGRAFAQDPLAVWLRERAPQRPQGVRARHPGLWRSLRDRLQLALTPDGAPALADQHAAAGLQDVVQALLRLPAAIEDTCERIDVHMDLACLPLPVRLAGLDRDPGWIPAAGCDVRFHFH